PGLCSATSRYRVRTNRRTRNTRHEQFGIGGPSTVAGPPRRQSATGGHLQRDAPTPGSDVTLPRALEVDVQRAAAGTALVGEAGGMVAAHVGPDQGGMGLGGV